MILTRSVSAPSTRSNRTSSNQAVPVPFPNPAKKTAARTLPSAGTRKRTDSSAQSFVPNRPFPETRVRPSWSCTWKVPATRMPGSTCRSRVRTQPRRR